MKVLNSITFTTAGMPQIIAWTPSALGSSLAGWFKADAGTTLSGSSVTAWADQSSNPANLSPTTAATSSQTAAPVLASGAVKAGKGIVFQGTSSGQNLAASGSKFGFNVGNSFSVGVALTLECSDLLQSFVCYSQAASPYGWFLGLLNGKLVFGFFTGSGNTEITFTGPALNNNTPYIIVATYGGNASSLNVYVNGSAVTMTSSGSLPSSVISGTQYFEVGGGGFEQANFNSGTPYGTTSTNAIGEVVVASIALSAAQVANLSQYMDTRYAIY